MKKIVLILLTLGFATSVFAQNTETRKLKSFTSLSVSEGIEVNLIKGSSTQAVITAKGMDLEEVLTEVSSGTLKIHLDGNNHNNVDVTIDLTYQTLESIRASSAAEVHSTSVIESNIFVIKASSAAEVMIKIKTKQLDVEASSAAEITVSGSADSQKVDVSSASEYKAFELISKVANVSASSAAEAKVNVSDELDASASSGAEVKYKGNPDKIREHSSSGGDVTQY